MKTTFFALLFFGLGLCSTLAYFTSVHPTWAAAQSSKQTSMNPVVYFEIPVTDIFRAKKFYEAVFGFSFTDQVIDGNQMALFPFYENGRGISGALAKGEINKPTRDGVVIYFATESIDKTLAKAVAGGGQVLYPKTSNGELGFVAEIEDSEGNRIALHEALK
jgi:predicted enzyme related to lactoylglutathione lyase